MTEARGMHATPSGGVHGAGFAPRGIDPVPLGSWLAKAIAEARPPFHYTVIAGGHSNITYRIDDGAGGRWVLRRPPLGPLAQGAHDVAREFRVIEALDRAGLPVPKALALCKDPTVTGAPFYVMNFVEGTVIDTPPVAERALPTKEDRVHATASLVDTLAALHRLDIDAIGLGDLGPRENYVGRQLKRMHGVWQKTKTRDYPLIDELHDRLASRIPPQGRASLIHCDYRFGNVMIGADGCVAAILDWELCALGEPLADIAFLCCGHEEPADPKPGVWMVDAPTRAEGFPSREWVIARYAKASGIAVGDLDYFRALAYWRIAVIAEGMKRRYESGALGVNEDAAKVALRVRFRAEAADDYLRRAGL